MVSYDDRVDREVLISILRSIRGFNEDAYEKDLKILPEHKERVVLANLLRLKSPIVREVNVWADSVITAGEGSVLFNLDSDGYASRIRAASYDFGLVYNRLRVLTDGKQDNLVEKIAESHQVDIFRSRHEGIRYIRPVKNIDTIKDLIGIVASAYKDTLKFYETITRDGSQKVVNYPISR